MDISFVYNCDVTLSQVRQYMGNLGIYDFSHEELRPNPRKRPRSSMPSGSAHVSYIQFLYNILIRNAAALGHFWDRRNVQMALEKYEEEDARSWSSYGPFAPEGDEESEQPQEEVSSESREQISVEEFHPEPRKMLKLLTDFYVSSARGDNFHSPDKVKERLQQYGPGFSRAFSDYVDPPKDRTKAAVRKEQEELINELLALIEYQVRYLAVVAPTAKCVTPSGEDIVIPLLPGYTPGEDMLHWKPPVNWTNVYGQKEFYLFDSEGKRVVVDYEVRGGVEYPKCSNVQTEGFQHVFTDKEGKEIDRWYQKYHLSQLHVWFNFLPLPFVPKEISNKNRRLKALTRMFGQPVDLNGVKSGALPHQLEQARTGVDFPAGIGVYKDGKRIEVLSKVNNKYRMPDSQEVDELPLSYPEEGMTIDELAAKYSKTKDEKYNRFQWQKLALGRWEDSGYQGMIEACTGAGKTNLCADAIKKILAKDPEAYVSVVVPTVALLYQWHDYLCGKDTIPGIEASYGLTDGKYNFLPGIDGIALHGAGEQSPLMRVNIYVLKTGANLLPVICPSDEEGESANQYLRDKRVNEFIAELDLKRQKRIKNEHDEVIARANKYFKQTLRRSIEFFLKTGMKVPRELGLRDEDLNRFEGDPKKSLTYAIEKVLSNVSADVVGIRNRTLIVRASSRPTFLHQGKKGKLKYLVEQFRGMRPADDSSGKEVTVPAWMTTLRNIEDIAFVSRGRGDVPLPAEFENLPEFHKKYSNHLLVVDEAHRAQAPTYYKVFDGVHYNYSLLVSATFPVDTKNYIKIRQASGDSTALQAELKHNELTIAEAPMTFVDTPGVLCVYRYPHALKKGNVSDFRLHIYSTSLLPDEQEQYDTLTNEINELMKRSEPKDKEAASRVKEAITKAEMAGEEIPLTGALEDVLELAKVTIKTGEDAGKKKLRSKAQLRAAEVEWAKILGGQRARISWASGNRFNCALELLRTLLVETDKKIIVFHKNIDGITAIYNALLKEGFGCLPKKDGSPGDDILGMYHSQQDDVLNTHYLAAFRRASGEEHSVRCLLSVEALLEGLDVPKADVGLCIAADQSLRKTVQALGRVLRRNKDTDLKDYFFINIDNTKDGVVLDNFGANCKDHNGRWLINKKQGPLYELCDDASNRDTYMLMSEAGLKTADEVNYLSILDSKKDRSSSRASVEKQLTRRREGGAELLIPEGLDFPNVFVLKDGKRLYGEVTAIELDGSRLMKAPSEEERDRITYRISATYAFDPGAPANQKLYRPREQTVVYEHYIDKSEPSDETIYRTGSQVLFKKKIIEEGLDAGKLMYLNYRGNAMYRTIKSLKRDGYHLLPAGEPYNPKTGEVYRIRKLTAKEREIRSNTQVEEREKFYFRHAVVDRNDNMVIPDVPSKSKTKGSSEEAEDSAGNPEATQKRYILPIRHPDWAKGIGVQQTRDTRRSACEQTKRQKVAERKQAAKPVPRKKTSSKPVPRKKTSNRPVPRKKTSNRPVPRKPEAPKPTPKPQPPKPRPRPRPRPRKPKENLPPPPSGGMIDDDDE